MSAWIGYDSTEEDAASQALKPLLPQSDPECPDGKDEATTDPIASSVQDLEVGLAELLDVLRPWAPYLQQLTERQDEILQLLQQSPPSPSVLDTLLQPNVRLAIAPTLERFNQATDKAVWLLAGRLALTTHQVTQQEWYHWALVEALTTPAEPDQSVPSAPEVLAGLF